MPLILGANSVTGGYEVDNSLRFNPSSSDYLNRTYGTPTNNKIWTFSFWLKRSELSREQHILNGGGQQNYFNTSDAFSFGDTSTQLLTTQVFRDTSAWYHIIIAKDSTQATASDRIKLYINGTQVTSFATATYPSLNTASSWNTNATAYYFGTYNPAPSGYYYSGYLSEFNLIDGQQLTPSDFGEFDQDSGIWKPIAYEGTYGTNGFYLEFKDSSALGDDTSGNGNDFTVNNLTSIDQTTDTCTNNFSTMNPLLTNDISTFSEGNCKLTTGSGASTSGASIAMTQGKWFAEFTCTAKTSVNMYVGIVRVDTFDGDNQIDEGNNRGYGYQNGGNILYPSGGAGDVYGASWTTGDIIGVAFDADTRNVTFYKNGVSQGVYTRIASDNTGGDWVMAVCEGQGAATATFECNFGNPVSTISSGNSDGNGIGLFEYSVPSGYLALCTANLATDG